MESSKWLAMVLLALLVMLGVEWSEGCLEEERLALLRLKPFFPSIDYRINDLELDYFEEKESSYSVVEKESSYYEEVVGLDYSVVEKENSPNCCEWERVECNPTTGRITHLYLNHTKREYIINWYLNASLFLPFEELQSLSLTGNDIAGCVDNQGFERLSSKLDKLEILDLSVNNFDDSIFASLSKVSSLRSLNLASNLFTGSNPSKGINMLSKLNNLEILDLSENYYLGNNILSRLGSFTSLISLRLQDCGLKGTVDMQGFNNLTNLKELYLEENEIESLGSLFHEIGRPGFNKLEVLGLSYNLFNNNIFSSFGALPNLKSLYLDSNQLKGSTNMKEFYNLINLKKLYLGNNAIESLGSFYQEKGQLGLIKLEVLDLSDNLLNDDIFSSIAALSNLKFLNLGTNRLKGQVHNKELRLKNLQVLDLSDNLFNDSSILSSLGMLSNLKTLSFGGSEFEGPVDIFDGFSNLEELYMVCYSGCSLQLQSPGSFPSLKTLSLKGFSFNDVTMASHSYNKWQILTNLKELLLEDSSLPLNFIRSLSSLKRLYVSFCNITDSLFVHEGQNLTSLEELTLEWSSRPSKFIRVIGPLTSLRKFYSYHPDVDHGLSMQDLCEWTNLQVLDIDNYLRGSLPMCFSNLTSLAILDLSYNELSGNITALKSLASLKWLDISNNKFQIPGSLGPLFNLSKLKYIRADNNIIYADADDEMPSLPPTFQLKKISFSCCGIGGSFPQFLHHQHDLLSVTLEHIYFKVNQFPFWLLDNNTYMGALHLINCSLSGPFQLPLSPHLVLFDLDVSNNHFSGNIPVEIGAYLPLLTTLNMSKNYFNGSIPSSFGDMSILQSLDLSNNQLSGGIPEHLAMGCSSLRFLALSNNTLQGTIFSGDFSLKGLYQLELDGNYFSGMIPNVLSNCSFLGTLDLSNNYLFGKIPSWIGSMPVLSTFDVSRNQLFGRIPQRMGNTSFLNQIGMADNHLHGSIPRALCNLNLQLEFLDLSMNNFSGTLPSCFEPSYINEVHLSKNMLQGPLPNAFRYSSTLVTLDLSYNHFSGNIPNWISNLSELSYLLLKRNHFEGEIPIQLCKLDHLSLIDLSENNLSGGIPSCLKVIALTYVPDDNSWISYNYLGPNSSISLEGPIEYTIKSRADTYKRRMLKYMSGIDLSCNKLTGEIPHETENISKLYALNLSHNSLTGPIPRAFSNLREIESLDLSYNRLTGNIPPEFAELHFLQDFNVSYNNLSGKTPERIGQLGTFDESSYVGNSFLCGSLVGRNCSRIEPPPTPEASTDDAEEHGLIDMDAFYASFVACYVVVILCIAAVLYINPYWRQAWFYYVQTTANSCYYFVIDNLPRKFRC